MKTSPLFICKVAVVVCLFLYVNFADISIFTNKIDAVLTLLFSIFFLFKSRNNMLVSLVAFFILYCNYSIVMGEYLIGGSLGVPVYEVKTMEIYGFSIRTLLLFIGIVTVFYNGKTINLTEIRLIPKSNMLIFYSLFLILIYVALFEVDRGELSSYSVRITPLYEYSTLLFLFAYYFSGNSLVRKVLFTSLLILFIMQDFYYGGRITAMQLIFLFLVTVFIQKLSFKLIVFYGFIGILLNSFIGAYRSNYSINSVNLLDTLVNLKNGFFVFSTPVFAYYASATHVAASQITTMDIKLSAFMAFVTSIFTGSNNELSNLTVYVSNHYFINIGGGVIPTHFYFWLGWTGVILISIIVVLLVNKLGGLKSDFQKICAVITIITVPRWYLYSPLSFFRPLLLVSILYLIFFVTNRVMSGIRRRRTTPIKTELITLYAK